MVHDLSKTYQLIIYLETDSFIFIDTRRLYDGVRRVSGLGREPVVSVKNPTLITIPH